MVCLTTASLSLLLVTGSFAWSSLNSRKLNEWFGAGQITGPGGTLHDDHAENGVNKDVYVENWGSENIFVRIRMDEYMETGSGAGLKSVDGTERNPQNLAVSLISGASLDKPDTWETHIPKASHPGECDTEADFHSYWNWGLGGRKYYYPVSVRDRSDKAYVDGNSPEGLDQNSVSSEGVPAKQTRPAQTLTIAQWKDAGSPIGDYWVYDTDGWAYWAGPLKPGEATGLLMDSVNSVKKPKADYYYAINVIAQMATKDGSDGDPLDNYSKFGLDENSGWTQDGHDLMDLVAGGASPESTAPSEETTSPEITAAPAADPEFNPPVVTVSGGTVIDNYIFVKPGEVIEFTADSTDTFKAMELSVNNALSDPSAAETDYYTITAPVGNNKLKNTFVFKKGMLVSYGARINAAVYGGQKINAADGTIGWAPKRIYDNTKCVISIPSDSHGIIKDVDGRYYLLYGTEKRGFVFRPAPPPSSAVANGR
jgi:hypothetical protein